MPIRVAHFGLLAAMLGSATPGCSDSTALTAADAGATSDAPASDAGGVSSAMTFFVTSRGKGSGGDLGGLDGADAFCRSLATGVSASLGAKTWRAYLSTSTVNARDRIGPGPWRNAAGVTIATSVEQLHDQGTNGTLNSTWPIGDGSVVLDEQGAPVPLAPQQSLVHDILTGTMGGGTVAAGLTCADWTSSMPTDTAEIGHSNRMGLAGQDPSWSSVHTVGCAQPTAGANFMSMTVSQGGGRGSIYCFALP